MRCVSLYLWCCWNLAAVIGQLKPVVEKNNEHEHILRIISKYDDFMHYKSFITFVGDLDVGEGESKITPSIEHRIMETFGRPVIVAGSETEWHINTLKYAKIGFLNEYQASIAVFQSPPYAFVYNSTEQRDLTGDNVSLGGQTGIMICEFLRFAKGTMQILQMSSEDYCPDSTQCRIGEKSIDIGANLVSNTNLSLYSPWVTSTKFCLVVPYERKVSFRNYVPRLWGNLSMTGFFIFYFMVNAVIKRLTNPRMPLCLLIFEAFELSWGLAVHNRVIRRMSRSEKIMMICSLLYSLLTISIFGSAVTTAITLGFNMPEIVDIDSFVANNISIMTSTVQIEKVLQIDSLPRALFDRMIFVDQSTLDHHLNSLNDSYVYILETHRWVQFEFIQKRLRQPKLKLASEPLCSVELHLRLPIHPDIPYTFALKRFIGQARETGLQEKWMRLGLQQLKRAKLIRQTPYEPPTQVTLPLEYFTVPFQFYATGILLSLFVLLIEGLYIQWHLRRMNPNNVLIV
ncbi:uncharacterized protein LOC117789494 [Drosophila innubila]|uniref:uncharacterized protein LOC117789494 n=1 Tax=Drosophila innubila TaxID=198719 RepID=UPI00148BB12E|nr:uncharacterized protein LOC117789494 [Drosophila innubila]